MIDLGDAFHIGVRVADLDAAMSEMGAALGVTWAAPQESDTQSVWTPAEGEHQVRLRYTYSVEGPQHIELVEGPPGSVWDGHQRPGAHHMGVWVDHIAAETERLQHAGWELVAAYRAPENGYGFFTYLQPRSGLIVELVDRALLAHFTAWWAAADGRQT
ncbi:MAG: VOC family protein [Actinomycetota bacterium]